MKMGLRVKLVMSFLQKTASQNNPKTPFGQPRELKSLAAAFPLVPSKFG